MECLGLAVKMILKLILNK